MDGAELSLRDRELIGTFVEAWEKSSHLPFEIDHGSVDHPGWPADVAFPQREEVRPLVHAGWLEVDREAQPAWRVWPSAKARELGAEGNGETEALADPDRRLGLILEATVKAFEADPAEPLLLLFLGQADVVKHAHWSLQPDAVRSHDLQQLEDLGLIASERRKSVAFWPTVQGRQAVRDGAAFLERLAQDAVDEHERSRLRQWAERLRAGDIAVSTVAGTTGAVIRAVIGL